jgi:hypothetical protein
MLNKKYCVVALCGHQLVSHHVHCNSIDLTFKRKRKFGQLV